MSSEEKNINQKSLSTYLPLSESCLKPKFLPNQNALNAFIRLVKESHDNTQKNPLMLSAFDSYRRPISEILSEMPGLTEDQKTKAIEAAKDLEKQPTRKKLECQF